MPIDNDKPTFDELSRDVLVTGRVAEMERYIQHGKTSTLDHCKAVARMSLTIARATRIPFDEGALVRGALLHDFFLYDWHDPASAKDRWHGFTHPGHALRNAEQDFSDLTSIERDVIKHHMFPFTPLPPHTREGFVVCLADKVCTVREFFGFKAKP